jgi:hypothetical protein
MNHSVLSNKHFKFKTEKVNIYGENIDTKSSAIKSFCYHPLSGMLQIDFNNKTTYVYFKVPSEVFYSFATAKSTGKAFHSIIIKKKFDYIKLDG